MGDLGVTVTQIRKCEFISLSPGINQSRILTRISETEERVPMASPQLSMLTDSPLARQHTSIFRSFTKSHLPQT